jgi:DNA helicase IV
MELGIDINAESFADRFAGSQTATDAQQAATDRTWKFGHVIVDEAQECSPMAWRMVQRRAPSRSMTIVGDLAQCGAAWAPASWADVLEPFARDRWRLVELSTNYRTPVEIMEVANAVLAVAAPDATPTSAIRSSGHLPRRQLVRSGDLADAVARASARMLDEIGDGRVAVVAPERVIGLLGTTLEVRLGANFDRDDPLGARTSLLSVGEVKGLEFDGVVLVEPGEIARRGSRGQNDLYVALTRATQRLLIVHEHALTSELDTHVRLLELP